MADSRDPLHGFLAWEIQFIAFILWLMARPLPDTVEIYQVQIRQHPMGSNQHNKHAKIREHPIWIIVILIYQLEQFGNLGMVTPMQKKTISATCESSGEGWLGSTTGKQIWPMQPFWQPLLFCYGQNVKVRAMPGLTPTFLEPQLGHSTVDKLSPYHRQDHLLGPWHSNGKWLHFWPYIAIIPRSTF